MEISIIMPCTLQEYEGGAKNRKEKLKRAIDSFLAQDYIKKNLYIICDGCFETMQFVSDNYNNEESIHVFYIDKQELFSGNVRDFGLKRADSEIITYLDADDYYEEGHLTKIARAFRTNRVDWIYFNDKIRYFANENLPMADREAKLQRGEIGTSNIAHKNFKSITWSGCDAYQHDYVFVERLVSQHQHYAKIDYINGYVVCHIPNSVDV